MKHIYLDYAASAPVASEVLRAMGPYFAEKFGNPGSLHSFGQEAIAAIDASREGIAKAIGADFREIIFTGSATEANNLALRGVLKEYRIRNLEFRGAEKGKKEVESLNPQSYILNPRIIVSSIEHESILETARDLEHDGVEVIYLPVERGGIVNLEKLKSALNERTILVSIMYANNEIGTIEPISEIAKLVQEFRIQNLEFRKSQNPKSYILSPISYPLFHADAAQAFQFLDCNAQNLGMDLMTLSAHKTYGPKGIGALYVRDGTKLGSVTTGGSQEFGLRSGTENVPLIVGFAKAMELVMNVREQEAKRIAGFRDHFFAELTKIYPKAKSNGPEKDSERLPNILNIYFPDYESQDLLTKFDLAGLAVSAGSACRSRAVESSYVIEALGYSKDRAKRSIRFSFGRPTTEKDVERALGVIKQSL